MAGKKGRSGKRAEELAIILYLRQNRARLLFEDGRKAWAEISPRNEHELREGDFVKARICREGRLCCVFAETLIDMGSANQGGDQATYHTANRILDRLAEEVGILCLDS